MTLLRKENVLKKLQKYIKYTSLDYNEYTKNLSKNNTDIKRLIINIEDSNHSLNEMPFIPSRRGGITGKFFNRIVKQFYWIIRNSVGPALNTQKQINIFLLNIIKYLDSEKSSVSEDKAELYNEINYDLFEEANRTDQIQLKQKQEIYLKYFMDKTNVLDIGCGRGEFLSLLKNNNIPSKGIDLNLTFVEYCQSNGLNVDFKDAESYLKELEDESLDGLIALQVIEHLSPQELTHLIQLAYSKIMPGGVIILETLNPQSLITFSSSFYKDLTHQNPIHPAAMLFLMKSAGFVECNIVYSSEIPESEKLLLLPKNENESSIIYNQNITTLNNLLYGPQDYAAIGRKS